MAAARAAINAEIRNAGVNMAELHPALIPAAKYQPQFSNVVEREHLRLDRDATSSSPAST